MCRDRTALLQVHLQCEGSKCSRGCEISRTGGASTRTGRTLSTVRTREMPTLSSLPGASRVHHSSANHSSARIAAVNATSSTIPAARPRSTRLLSRTASRRRDVASQGWHMTDRHLTRLTWNERFPRCVNRNVFPGEPGWMGGTADETRHHPSSQPARTGTPPPELTRVANAVGWFSRSRWLPKQRLLPAAYRMVDGSLKLAVGVGGGDS